MQPTANITSNNARIAHIRKFCAMPPERGQVLRLVSIEEPPATLGEWMRQQCIDNGSTAEDVDGRLTEHVQTIGEDLQFTLAWLGASGEMVVSKRLKGRYVVEAQADIYAAQSEALGIVGTETGRVVQMQRHMEAMTRTYLSAHQTQIQTFATMVRDLGSMINESNKTAHVAHLELDKQRLAHRKELEAMADEAIPHNVEGEARAELLGQVATAFEKVLPMVIQGAMAALAQSMQAKAAAAANTNGTHHSAASSPPSG